MLLQTVTPPGPGAACLPHQQHVDIPELVGVVLCVHVHDPLAAGEDERLYVVGGGPAGQV